MQGESSHDPRLVRLACAVLFIFLMLLVGCESSKESASSPQLDAFRSQLVVSVEPEGATTIEDARAKLLGETGDDSGGEDAEQESPAEETVASGEESSASPAATPSSALQDIVLIARVGNRDIRKWWDEQRATLVVSEGSPKSHYNAGPDHDPKDCPFCRSRWKNEDSMAFVKFVDSSGATIPADARQLLNVDAEDFIVVRGTGELDENSMLNIAASEVYIRPSESP